MVEQAFAVSTPSPTPAVNSMADRSDMFMALGALAQYPIHQCGANDGIDVGLMSAVILLSTITWIGIVLILAIWPQLYIRVMSFFGTLLALYHYILQVSFSRPSPVSGCGLHNAWPSPYIMQASFLAVTLMCYSRDFAHQSIRCRAAAIGVMAMATHSVLYVGYADTGGVLSATLIGGGGAYFHHAFVLTCQHSEVMYEWLVVVIRRIALAPTKLADDVLKPAIERERDELLAMIDVEHTVGPGSTQVRMGIPQPVKKIFVDEVRKARTDAQSPDQPV